MFFCPILKNRKDESSFTVELETPFPKGNLNLNSVPSNDPRYISFTLNTAMLKIENVHFFFPCLALRWIWSPYMFGTFTMDWVWCNISSQYSALLVLYISFCVTIIYLLLLISPIIWQVPRADIMKQIQCCDWLPERERWGYRFRSERTTVATKNRHAEHFSNMLQHYVTPKEFCLCIIGIWQNEEAPLLVFTFIPSTVKM